MTLFRSMKSFCCTQAGNMKPLKSAWPPALQEQIHYPTVAETVLCLRQTVWQEKYFSRWQQGTFKKTERSTTFFSIYQKCFHFNTGELIISNNIRGLHGMLHKQCKCISSTNLCFQILALKWMQGTEMSAFQKSTTFFWSRKHQWNS